MRNEPLWPTPEALIQINADEVEATGEPHALLSRSLLESAWAKPIHLWFYGGEADIVRLAVTLMAGIARNHAFQQGNKRTAFLAGVILIEANGLRLEEAADSTSLADDFVRLIEQEIDEAAFADILRTYVVG